MGTEVPDPPPPPPPLKNKKTIGFHSNSGPDPLKGLRPPSQHSMLGHHGHASETPLKWGLACELMLAPILWFLDPLSSSTKKNNVKAYPLWQNFLDPRMCYMEISYEVPEIYMHVITCLVALAYATKICWSTCIYEYKFDFDHFFMIQFF